MESPNEKTSRGRSLDTKAILGGNDVTHRVAWNRGLLRLAKAFFSPHIEMESKTMMDIEGVKRFHGHWCPGLAIGVRVAELALQEIGPHAGDEEIVAIVEADNCAVDAIQYFTGCTFGKGNLIHRDYGKNAFTFVRRSDDKAIRIVARPGAWGPPDPEQEALLKRVREGQASEADQQRAQRLRQERLEAILAAPARQLFEVQPVEPAVPARAGLYESLACAGCGEMVMETRVRLLRGQPYCIPCFEMRDRRL